MSRSERLALIPLLVGVAISSASNVSVAAAEPPQPAPAASCDSDEAAPSGRRLLRVAADPNSLPLSNRQRQGIENKLAELIAREMKADLEYVWHAQRRGFFRRTMSEGNGHVSLSAPSGFHRALTTRPYYRSTYMFVTRKDRELKIRSLDDPRLRELKIGVQVIGDDGLNSPPAHALAARGVVDNVMGYSVYGDYSLPNPQARIIEAVSNGEVDVAVAWGPLAGYFAPRQPEPLELTPLPPNDEPSGQHFAFDICVGVRKDNRALREEVDAILERCREEIDAILDEYGVPRLPMDEPSHEEQ